eukprot:14221962-Ditylum_brightwellii.AAC.1
MHPNPKRVETNTTPGTGNPTHNTTMSQCNHIPPNHMEIQQYRLNTGKTGVYKQMASLMRILEDHSSTITS